MGQIPLVVHATHEAGAKVGGIGAVLDGLLGADAYIAGVRRSIVVGPMFGWDSVQMERLTSSRNGLSVRYSSLHGIYEGVDEETRAALQAVEQAYHVGVLYGLRRFGAAEHEIILVDASNPDMQQVNTFKYYVWENYGIDVARYEHDMEFNLYFSIAPALFAALSTLQADVTTDSGHKIILAHEWLGMPVVFAAQMADPGGWRSAFYAHETAPVRRLIEDHGGHDTRFYNVMQQAIDWNLHLDTVFGDQNDLYKTPILRRATHCDTVLAVSDRVKEELQFVGDDFRQGSIDLVYNGIPSFEISLEEKKIAKQKLQQYCRNLLGYWPDFVFTHVTRLVQSKALWRDIRVLDHLAPLLRDEGRSAVLFVLSTSVAAGRPTEWVQSWEAEYGWPVAHRSDNGDLVDLEIPYFYTGVVPFNQRATNIRIVFVNQFGWSPDRCGSRMPDGMEFMDIRKGSDLEFGQSIYEPFGIAQLEPLSFGALCCVSDVCGCLGFLQRVAGPVEDITNVVVADYTSLPDEYSLASPYAALAIDQGVRDWIEGINSETAARRIFDMLPRNDLAAQTMLSYGQDLAQKMSWEVVAGDYLLPGLRRISEPS